MITIRQIYPVDLQPLLMLHFPAFAILIFFVRCCCYYSHIVSCPHKRCCQVVRAYAATFVGEFKILMEVYYVIRLMNYSKYSKAPLSIVNCTMLSSNCFNFKIFYFIILQNIEWHNEKAIRQVILSRFYNQLLGKSFSYLSKQLTFLLV